MASKLTHLDIVDEQTWEEVCKGIRLANICDFFPSDEDKSHELRRVLQIIGMLPCREDAPPCENCSNPKLGVFNEPDTLLGFRFGCWQVNRRTGRKCSFRVSALRGTIFENSHLNFSKVIQLCYCFVTEIEVTSAAYECDVAVRIAVDHYSYFREVCEHALCEDRNGRKIGGPNTTVELDESHLCKRKYHRGRQLITETFWIFGGLCRETREAFMRRVEHRDRNTLFDLIFENVEKGSTLCTDDWRAYRGIDAHGYTHKVVIHKYYFVDPQDPTNYTNTLERQWRGLKENLPSFRFNLIEKYTYEYLYKERFFKIAFDQSQPELRRKVLNGGQKLKIFLEHLKDLYHGFANPLPPAINPQVNAHVPINLPIVPPNPLQGILNECQNVLSTLCADHAYDTLVSFDLEIQNHTDVIDRALQIIRNHPHTHFQPQHVSQVDNRADVLHAAFREHYEPLITPGDGDCFYMSISTIVFGHHRFFELVRLVTLHIAYKYRVQFNAFCIPGVLPALPTILLSIGCPGRLKAEVQVRYAISDADIAGFNYVDSIALEALSIALTKNLNIYTSFLSNGQMPFLGLTDNQLNDEFEGDTPRRVAHQGLHFPQHVVISPWPYLSAVKLLLINGASGGHYMPLLPKQNNTILFTPARQGHIVLARLNPEDF
ncbi:hypothetical protein B566_EDAN015737 [Ephemera danica]|nr:hypothetical protein B566_EDAN015737 [Ephemera danica]